VLPGVEQRACGGAQTAQIGGEPRRRVLRHEVAQVVERLTEWRDRRAQIAIAQRVRFDPDRSGDVIGLERRVDDHVRERDADLIRRALRRRGDAGRDLVEERRDPLR